MDEQKKNRGSLSRNDKGGKETRPDYKGSITIEGKKYWLSGWVRQSQTPGEKFLSLEATLADPPASTPAATGEAKPLEDLPF
jgi:hypothetical protein